MKNCPRCLSPMDDEEQFCGVCGLQLEDSQSAAENEQTDSTHIELEKVADPHKRSVAEEPASGEKTENEPEKKPFPWKWVIIGAAVLTVVVVAVLLTWLLRSKPVVHSAYIQDGNLMLLNTKTGESTLVFDDMLGADGRAGAGKTVLTADGKTLFFTTPSDGGETLYRYRMTEKDSTPQKVADHIADYAVSENGEAALYTDAESVVYYTDFSTKDKLGAVSKTVDYEMKVGGPLLLSADGKTIVYRLADNKLYQKQQGAAAVLIADKVMAAQCVTKDLSVLYYLVQGDTEGSGTLYRRENGKATRIDTNVVSMTAFSDGCYFTKNEPFAVNAYDFVVDDKPTEIPEKPVAPNPFQYSRTEYETALADYRTLKAAYDEAMTNAELRTALQTETLTVSETALYYYNGKTVSLMADTVVSPVLYAEDNAVAVYTAVQLDKIGKTNLSQLSSCAQLVDALYAAFQTNEVTTVAVKTAKQTIAVSKEELADAQISADGRRLFYVGQADTAEKTACVLTLDANGRVVKKATVKGEHAAWHEASGMVVVGTDKSEDGPTVYKNTIYDGNKKVTDKSSGILAWDSAKQTLYYMVDYDADKQRGTVMMYTRGGTSLKLADDVHELAIDTDGRVTYLTEYDAAAGTGVVYVYDGDKHNNIAEEVQTVLTVSSPSVFVENGCIRLQEAKQPRDLFVYLYE